MINVNFSELTGKTLINIEGMEEGSESIIFSCSDGSKYKLYHSQDCCESVRVESINGDVQDLLNTRINLAEEVGNYETEDKPKYSESYTWTFYKLGTIKGYVDIRWLGESNGYYSEGVDFCLIEKREYL
jgi:hypothetical protein